MYLISQLHVSKWQSRHGQYNLRDFESGIDVGFRQGSLITSETADLLGFYWDVEP